MLTFLVVLEVNIFLDRCCWQTFITTVHVHVGESSRERLTRSVIDHTTRIPACILRDGTELTLGSVCIIPILQLLRNQQKTNQWKLISTTN